MAGIIISKCFNWMLHYNHIVTCRRIGMSGLGTGCIADFEDSRKKSSTRMAAQNHQIYSNLKARKLA